MALIVAAVLALAGVGALAASLLWRDQAASMKQIEQSGGDYAGWSIEDKAALVRALVDSGHLMQGGETERLFDEGTPEAERHAIADALLLALTGQTAVEEISVDIITYAVMGAEDTWTPEERVWWQQLTRRFDGDDGADDTFIVPDGSVISEAQAVTAAREAILSARGLEEGALDAGPARGRPLCDAAAAGPAALERAVQVLSGGQRQLCGAGVFGRSGRALRRGHIRPGYRRAAS